MNFRNQKLLKTFLTFLHKHLILLDIFFLDQL